MIPLLFLVALLFVWRRRYSDHVFVLFAVMWAEASMYDNRDPMIFVGAGFVLVGCWVLWNVELVVAKHRAVAKWWRRLREFKVDWYGFGCTNGGFFDPLGFSIDPYRQVNPSEVFVAVAGYGMTWTIEWQRWRRWRPPISWDPWSTISFSATRDSNPVDWS